MNWERRLRDMVLAGGAFAVAGCSSSPEGGVPCGNANPDPCICGRPEVSSVDRLACDEQQDCEADGGTYVPYAEGLPDGGVRPPHCIPPYSGPDASVDGEPDEAGDGDADGLPSD